MCAQLGALLKLTDAAGRATTLISPIASLLRTPRHHSSTAKQDIPVVRRIALRIREWTARSLALSPRLLPRVGVYPGADRGRIPETCGQSLASPSAHGWIPNNAANLVHPNLPLCCDLDQSAVADSGLWRHK